MTRIGLALYILILLAARSADPPSDVSAQTAQTLRRAPDGPLDTRITPDRITESELPPLPSQVILPLPPTFVLATDPSQVPIDPQHFALASDAIERGLRYLRVMQTPQGAWMANAQATPTDQPDAVSPITLAVTAMGVKAFVQADPESAIDGPAAAGLRFLRRGQRDDGAYEGGALTNYVTAAVVSALAATDNDEDADSLQNAVQWLMVNQWDQTEGLAARQDWFGGAGYGGRGRPDASNTQIMLDALHDAGVSPDEPAVQRALAFISRAQNLQETNKATWAGDDGGFIYTPANGGESMASEAAGEGRSGELIPAGAARSLRSYGSMTYAGFKSMLYAGLSPDDVRVRAAFDWIRRHWTFDENPGLGLQGLYYYYHTMARALAVAQQYEITDLDGTAHNWRQEMIDAIVSRQHENGSWANEADRWLEAETELATIYAVLALEEILKPVTPIE